MSALVPAAVLAVALVHAPVAAAPSGEVPAAESADAPAPAREEAPVPEEAPAREEAPLPEDDWLFDEDLDADVAEIPVGEDPAARDPIQPVNRAFFHFNERFLDWVADPVSRAYHWALPDPGRRAIRRFFENLEQPVIFANHVLQFAPGDAAHTAGRFLVNSTVGVAGFFDPAGRVGLEGEHTDFGETLAAYWAPPGPYLVIPVIGPSTVRDAFGEAVDRLLRPDLWLFGASMLVIVDTGHGLTTYDIERSRLEALRETSVDFYSALRGAYLMDRDAAVDARLDDLSWRRCDDEPEEATGALP